MAGVKSEPPLPFFKALPAELVIECAIGYLYGRACQVNPILTMSIFTIRCLADNCFYHLANAILEGKDLHAHKIFIATTTFVNMTFLIVIRELNLIGRLASCMLGLCFVGLLVHRVDYIQSQERQLKDDQAVLDPDDL